MKHTRNLQDLAKQNRRNPTDAERKMWSLLRKNGMGAAFRRQHQIGQYIVDFVCLEKKLIIECDGSQHLDNRADDTVRTSFLESQGYHVIRFWNNDILYETDGVYMVIEKALRER